VIAALFVEKGGVYYGLPDVDPWDEARDARTYDGPWPVVAHPPCARWCRLAGWVEARGGARRGEDGGTFAAALAAVRRVGGVIEHPAYSAAWDAFNLPEPLVVRGWTGGLCGGFAAYVEQGRYGHPVKKATWLYARGVELLELRWGLTPDAHDYLSLDWTGATDRPRVPRTWRSGTPPEFRDVLLAMARSAVAGAA